MNLYKCDVCNLIIESEEQVNICPKCKANSEHLHMLNEDTKNKIYAADKTNALLATLVSLSDQILKISKEGLDINLDPGCNRVFSYAKNEAYSIRQFAKSEIETHVKKDKF